MAMNAIQQAAADGKATFGVWSSAPSQAGAEILGRSGIDWVLLDLQHGAGNEGDLLPLIQAIELGGSSPLVRVGWCDPQLIMRAMDLGAMGFVVPMVSTPEQAHTAAQPVRYPPQGYRSLGPLRRGINPGSDEPAPHTCVVMVETVEAMPNVDAIAATPGVDVGSSAPSTSAWHSASGSTSRATTRRSSTRCARSWRHVRSTARSPAASRSPRRPPSRSVLRFPPAWAGNEGQNGTGWVSWR